MEKVKSKPRISGASVAIVALSILLIATIGIGIALAYFTSNATATGSITLGDPVTISITQGGASVSSLTFDDKALPGSIYKQPIGISSPAKMTEALMRAKLTITDADGSSTNVEATTTTNWIAGEDNYYYYNGSILANGNIDFITAIKIPTTLTNEAANTTYTIDIVVEAIQRANNAANAVWTTAPEEWLNTYSPVPTEAE